MNFKPINFKTFDEFKSYLEISFSKRDLLGIDSSDEQIYLTIIPTANFRVIKRLKDDNKCSFNRLIDITAYEEDGKTFLVYLLNSEENNVYLHVKTSLVDDNSVISLYKLYKNSAVLECEVRDFYGISFSSHPDQRHLFFDEKDCLSKDYVEILSNDEGDKC
ncbi:MAG: NADH-quinone oxidoreductase subunit C [Alphaproteobacteria bacterium]|nr:NADH-quinone oxidoreductase subunit C [Alphaproteobacteria bacterium]